MRTALGLEDLGGFVDEPHVAVLATIRRDGSPLLSPVWHRWLDGGFDLWIGSSDVKVRHLRRDPRATLVIAESGPPLRGVELRAEARFITEDAFERAVAVASRYLGDDKGRAYVGSFGTEHLIVRLEPGELRAWDFADEYGDGRF